LQRAFAALLLIVTSNLQHALHVKQKSALMEVSILIPHKCFSEKQILPVKSQKLGAENLMDKSPWRCDST
jgi:hypothetical protein